MRFGSVLVTGAILAAAAVVVLPASALEPRSLARAQTIRSELDARYRVLPGRGLAVTEATSTGVVESFALLTPNLLEMRVVSAANGIWYAACPVGATCPYPLRRFVRPAADVVVRRLALELALRTFLETRADVVGVSLPTTRFLAFVAERTELAREVDLARMEKALRGDPSRVLTTSLAQEVDRLTRPRVFVGLGLRPTASGRDAWVGVPRWTSEPVDPPVQSP